MKKLRAKLPGGGSIDIDVHEIPIPADGSMTASEYQELLKQEEAYDQELQRLAIDAAGRLESAEKGDRAIEYWEVGKMMLEHERRVEVEDGNPQRPEYERAGRTRSRLLDKVGEIRRERGAKKTQYSPHYLRKFIRFAKLVTREQAARPVPYSLQHELIYEGLTPQDRDSFLERCEKGEIRTNTQLRALVKGLIVRKARGASEQSPSSTVIA